MKWLIPVVAFEADVGGDEADGYVDDEEVLAGVSGLEGGFGDGVDGIAVGGVHGVDAAGPCPVGADEGAGDGFDAFWEGEDGS